nr:MAG: hypothetical protein [Bacteriophage sp.]
MNTFNNFSPLAFREKSMKATYKKWYSYGKEFALPFSTTELPPFQFTVVNLPVFDPSTVEVFLVNEATGVRGATGINPKFDTMDEHNAVLYVSPGSNVYAKPIEPGVYRAEFAIPGGETYVSTPICVTEGIETNTNFVKLEYWNDEKLAYPNGFVTTGTDNDFKFQMYIPTTFFKPKYEFEEEITKRAGYKFLELQTCNKVFGFNFLAPEYICDALRLVRLSDYIRFTHDGEYYNALNFEYNPDWQDNGYLAAIECQFETDTIIQKLPSFNRRDRESFYNALLADIDTPILFSPDTVGLYYREFKQGEPTIKGKLIRELSPIDLIDENTTIAVDMGAGEARKFNLFKMLEGYISKNHDDVTEFLLSLHAGVNIGTPNASGEYPATIDRYGDAKLGSVDGGKARFDSVETGFFTVNNTAATIDGMGNADVNELTARGDSLLRGDVWTGFKNGGATGKITKEGQLQYLSAVIQEFITSPTFVPGFLGEGFKIWVENGNWHIECDNLTVRQTMNIFELLIQKIRSVNGALVVSQSNGKLSAVEEVGTQYKLTTGEEFPTFQEGDLVRCQTFAGYQGAGLAFDFTQFAKYDYSGGAFDSSLIDVTPDSISFNLNDTGNSGFAFYKFSESSPTPIEIPSFTLTLEGGYPGMMAFAAGLDSNDSPVEGVGVLLQNGDNVIPAIKSEQGIHNFAITITGDSGHGDGKVTVKQKKAAGSAPNNSLVKFYWVEVKAVDGVSFFVDKAEFNGVVPAVGDEVVQMGNTKNPERQALIYITAQESGHPYIEILNGVKTKSLSGTNRTRLGDLSNIQDSAFPEGQQPSGSGLYCDNAFLRGIFLLRNGKSVEDEVNQAKQDAANAATEAERAQQTAQEAKDRLNKWADDGFISPTEKPALIDEGKRIQAEFLQIKNNADKYGVPVSEYTKAYEDYLNELRYHSAQQPEDIAVRPELANTQTIYYDRRNGALNAIANAAKEYVDEADKKLKEYLDTEITAIPGKIELAVRSLKVADVNLLYDSNHKLNANPNQMGAYKYDIHLEVGKTYTLTVCYKCVDSDVIRAYNNPSYGWIGSLPKSAEETVLSQPITPINSDGAYFYFYKFPQQESTGTYIKWAVITEGSVGVANWIPSATERKLNIGGENLMLQSQQALDGSSAQYAFQLSKAWKDLKGKTLTISFDYAYSNLKMGSSQRFGLEKSIYKSGTSQYYYIGAFKYVDSTSPTTDKGRYVHTIKVPDDIEDSLATDITAYIQLGGSTVCRINNFQIEIGDTATGWKPAPKDSFTESKKYTDTQILAVDGKIELSVKTKVESLGIGANNLYSYTSSTLNTLYPSPIIERKMSLHGFYLVGSKGNGGAMRIPNIIPPIPGKYTVSGWIKGSQSTPVGFTIEVCESENVIVKSTADNQWSYFKHTFNVTKNTEEQKDVYNFVDIQRIDWAYIWVKDFKVEAGEIATAWSPNFQDAVYKGAEYTNSQISVVEGKITSTVEKINTVDGRVTGLASRVEQTEKSIALTANKVDDQGRRLSAAELTLSSDHAKLSVVEQTANSANSLAGTANNKAEAADGRVTATQNGLVETGINITSRKIVLKSDNVLFQNNAGQQTAALNANGRLTANVIEAGEVVANGFAAQRITTGNLTVTDGAVIAGMSISGNRLTGGNITLTNGARIGSFQVSLNWLTGLNGSQIDLWAGANTGDGNETLMQPGRILIKQKGDNQPALEIQGKGNTLIAGKYCSLNVDTFQVTANQVRIPGVFFACSLLHNATIGKTWGSFNFHITGFRKLSTGRYTVTYTGYTGDVYIMLQPMEYTKWGCACIEPYSQGSFTYKTFDANSGLFDCAVIAYFCGMPS